MAPGPLVSGSLAELAWQGIQDAARAPDLCLQVSLIEPDNPASYPAALEKRAALHDDLILTVGVVMAQPTLEAARDNPDTRFATLDTAVTQLRSNLVGVVFREDQGGYLAGALAGLLTRTGVVAGIYGLETPEMRRYRLGFDAGVRTVNPGARILEAIQPATTVADARWGIEQASLMIASGADVVFGAGLPGAGALQAAAGRGRLCIGADVDRWSVDPSLRPCLVSSALKRLDTAVRLMVEEAANNRWESGLRFMDVGNQGIGLAPAHGLAAQVPAQVSARLSRIATGLASGSLQTGVPAT